MNEVLVLVFALNQGVHSKSISLEVFSLIPCRLISEPIPSDTHCDILAMHITVGSSVFEKRKNTPTIYLGKFI